MSIQLQNNSVIMQLNELLRVFKKILDAYMFPLGMNFFQYRILLFVKRYGRISQKDLVQMLHSDRSTISTTLRTMQEKGWLRKKRAIGHRALIVILTKEGERMVSISKIEIQQLEQRFSENISQIQYNSIEGIKNAVIATQSKVSLSLESSH